MRLSSNIETCLNKLYCNAYQLFESLATLLTNNYIRLLQIRYIIIFAILPHCALYFTTLLGLCSLRAECMRN